MKLVPPSAQLIVENDPLKRIELCGRVCYKSEDRITEDSARTFVANIIKRGHTSVLEHARVKIEESALRKVASAPNYGWYRSQEVAGSRTFIVLNARDLYESMADKGQFIDFLAQCKLADDFHTIRFILDRGCSHEITRHRVFSFSQESTRYVNYKTGVEFIYPHPFSWADPGTEEKSDFHFTYKAIYFESFWHRMFRKIKGWFINERLIWQRRNWAKHNAWIKACKASEKAYKRMIKLGCSPQEARAVLPNSLKTEVLMTGTFDQWQAMFKLRVDKAAHPQMRELAYAAMLLINKAHWGPKG